MEIGDEGVDATEGARRVDEDLGFAGVGVVVLHRCGMPLEKVFERSNRGGADGDAASPGARREQGALGRGGKFVEFAMDGVGFDGVGRNRFERPETDVKRDIRKIDTGGGERLEQLGREVEAGGGGGDGDLAGAVGVDRLITFGVRGAGGDGAVALNVRGQRDLTLAIGDGGDRLAGGRGEAHVGGAVGFFGDDFAGEGAGGVGERGADGEFAAGFYEAAPSVVAIDGTEEEAFDLAAGGTSGVKSRGENGGVVAKKRVSRAEESREIGETVVGEGVRRALDDEEPGLIAAGGRSLRDEVRRKLVVEKFSGERHGGREDKRSDSAVGRVADLRRAR